MPAPTWNRSRLRAFAGRLATACLLLGAGAGAAAAPADDPSIAIELNRLEDMEGGCRISFVLTNALPVSVEAMSIEAVLFAPNGGVERFLLLKTRPLPQGRTRVQQFDVASTGCGDIGQILLNDVTACTGDGLDAAGCLTALRPSSRTAIPFVTALTPTGD